MCKGRSALRCLSLISVLKLQKVIAAFICLKYCHEWYVIFCIGRGKLEGEVEGRLKLFQSTSDSAEDESNLIIIQFILESRE